MSNILLLFFAIPIAIIILSIIFETLINCPIKIAGITFSILLIVTFAIGDETLLIFTILYTILSYLVAWITKQWLCNQTEENCLEQLIQNANMEATQNLQNTQNTQTSNTYSCGCNRRRLF